MASKIRSIHFLPVRSHNQMCSYCCRSLQKQAPGTRPKLAGLASIANRHRVVNNPVSRDVAQSLESNLNSIERYFRIVYERVARNEPRAPGNPENMLTVPRILTKFRGFRAGQEPLEILKNPQIIEPCMAI